MTSKIPCENCICLSVCLQRITFEPNNEYSFGYKTTWVDYQSCDFVKSFINSSFPNMHSINWDHIKKFFLHQKELL